MGAEGTLTGSYSGSTHTPSAARISTIGAGSASQYSQSADWQTPTVGSFTVASSAAENFAANYK
jgi:hypothetical protein